MLLPEALENEVVLNRDAAVPALTPLVAPAAAALASGRTLPKYTPTPTEAPVSRNTVAAVTQRQVVDGRRLIL